MEEYLEIIKQTGINLYQQHGFDVIAIPVIAVVSGICVFKYFGNREYTVKYNNLKYLEKENNKKW